MNEVADFGKGAYSRQSAARATSSPISPISFQNPYNVELNLRVTPWITIPSYILLITTSAVLLYIIYKHFSSVLEIYISVIFYLISQLLLLLTLTISWISELIYPGQSQDQCQIKLALQTLAVTLPGYSILIITVSRAVFLSCPLSYLRYLKLKFQLLSFITAGLMSGLVSTLPLFGVCPAVVVPVPGLEICYHGDRRKPSCTVFCSVLLVLGFFLPLLAVISLYIYIYKVVLTARKSHLQLSSTVTSTIESNKGTKHSIERRSVPWYILAILVMTVTTTVPWGVMTLFTVEMTEMITEGGDVSLMFDLLYSLLQVLIGCSPLVYLLTTNSLKQVVVRDVRKSLSAVLLKITK